MNVELLLEVRRHILEEPKRLDMNYILGTKETLVHHFRRLAEDNLVPSCGTVGCINGWGLYLNHLKNKSEYEFEFNEDLFADCYPYPNGQIVFDITEGQALRLFTSPQDEFGGRLSWPEDLGSRFTQAKDKTEQAQITAERIDRFIATKGEQ